MIEHNITLDVRKRQGHVPARLTMRRGEAESQQIIAALTNDGATYTPKYSNARLQLLHADGTWVRTAATLGSGTVEVVLPSEALNSTGRCRLAYFEFYDTDGVSETTESFELVIEGNVDGTTDPSESYSDELDELYKRYSAFEEQAEAAEKARAEAEEKRVAAETERSNNESTRKASEMTRAEAEEKRVAAETERVSESKTAVADAELATKNAKTATENANKAAETAYAAAQAVSEATIGLSPTQLSAMVKLGTAPIVLPVGSQLTTKLEGNGYTVENFAWDVVHHFDGSDDDHPLVTLEDGSQVKGMMIQAHRTVPWGIVWEPKQAAIVVTGDMPAGTYHFTVKVTVAWAKGIAAEVGEKTYQFTTTQALSAGAQLVYTGGEATAPTAASLQAYASSTSTTVVDTCALSLGSAGADLGTMTDATPSANAQTYAELNNIQRMIYGSNRWSTSQEREALNSDVIAQGGTAFSRPWGMVGKSGLPACLPADFIKVLGKIERKQELHPWDGGEIETTYDTFFPISAREHGFSSYLSATADGFKAEGVPLDYWTKLRTASGRTAWSGWQTYPELITYDSKATTTARSVWLRSANRHANSAYIVGCVNTSGNVGVSNAYYGYYAAPACIIV